MLVRIEINYLVPLEMILAAPIYLPWACGRRKGSHATASKPEENGDFCTIPLYI